MFLALPRVRGLHRKHVLTVFLSCFLLCGCDYIASALPPTPSPFPTLARLPTVTPAPPTPTIEPTPTPVPPPPTSTPTPTPLEASTRVGANVREGPGLDYAVIGSVRQNEAVVLHGIYEGWYRVTTGTDLEGWMASDVLVVAPDVATAVPTTQP
jgi:hypothetical protein